jgi:hypothetical protein
MRNEEHDDPVRVRDLTYARQAFDKLLTIHRSTCAAFGKPDTASFRTMNVVRDVLADLKRSAKARLTDAQRKLVAKVLGLQELPSAVGETPPGLRFLPRKPPGHPEFGPVVRSQE